MSFFKKIHLFLRRKNWEEDINENILRRKFRTYEDYLKRQKAKLKKKLHSEYEVKYREELKKRLRETPFLKEGMVVLCLGARIGTEVKAFHDIGCFAVGIDLNPGKENKYVLESIIWKRTDEKDWF